MGFEIERKYIVSEFDTSGKTGNLIHQAWLTGCSVERPIRIRIIDNKVAFLTIKGPGGGSGLRRDEFEYEIPLEDATDLMARHCESKLSKIRYPIQHEGHLWEIDVFLGDFEGLILAEIELEKENETFIPFPGIGTEVSMDSRYTNISLALYGAPDGD